MMRYLRITSYFFEDFFEAVFAGLLTEVLPAGFVDDLLDNVLGDLLGDLLGDFEAVFDADLLSTGLDADLVAGLSAVLSVVLVMDFPVVGLLVFPAFAPASVTFLSSFFWSFLLSEGAVDFVAALVAGDGSNFTRSLFGLSLAATRMD